MGELQRIKSGISGLDKLIDGGFPKDDTVMVRGSTGTGKTLFCLQYLYNGATELDEPGIFISFGESKDAIFQHGKIFSWDFEKLAQENKFAIIRYEPHEVASIMEEGGGTIRDTIEQTGAKRLVIDSITSYEMVFENKYKASESILSLFKMLRGWDITTVVSSEYPVTFKKSTGGKLGSLVDGIINMYYTRNKSHRARSLEIIKMRDTAHDDTINSFVISKKGIEVG